MIGTWLLLFQQVDLRKRSEKAACRGGDTRTCLALGHLYEDDRGLLGDKATARTYYRLACDQGSAPGCFRAGWLSAFGGDAIFSAPEQLRGFGQGCEGNIPEACFQLGLMHVTGEGVGKDEVKGAALFTRGCEGGVLESCFWLGLFHAQGRGGFEADVKVARELFQRACDGGVEQACSELH